MDQGSAAQRLAAHLQEQADQGFGDAALVSDPATAALPEQAELDDVRLPAADLVAALTVLLNPAGLRAALMR